jgi:hypothetical protein
MNEMITCILFGAEVVAFGELHCRSSSAVADSFLPPQSLLRLPSSGKFLKELYVVIP